jgi:hypothetical protein
LRNFQKFFNMRMSQHSSSVQKRLRQIADVKLNDDIVFISSFNVFVLKTIIIAVWNMKILVIFSLI